MKAHEGVVTLHQRDVDTAPGARAVSSKTRLPQVEAVGGIGSTASRREGRPLGTGGGVARPLGAFV